MSLSSYEKNPTVATVAELSPCRFITLYAFSVSPAVSFWWCCLGTLFFCAVFSSPPPPLGGVSLDSWFLGLPLLVRASFQLCLEVKGLLKLLASYCEVQCIFGSSSWLVAVEPR